jgi:hypothetical protein
MIPKIPIQYKLALCAGLLILAACGPTGTPAGSTASQPIIFTLTAKTAEVYSGPSRSNTATPLPTVEQGQSIQFVSGNVVTTDATDGEALLESNLNGKAACKVYVFYSTTINKCACSRDSCPATSNESCVEAGSAVYQDCANHLTSTPTGEFQHTGTRLGVIYDPVQNLSVFILLEGKGTLTPIDPVTHIRGTPVNVDTLNPQSPAAPEPKMIFVFRGEGNRMVSNLRERTPLALNLLPAFLSNFPILIPWTRPVQNYARQTGVSFPDLSKLLNAPYMVVSVKAAQWEPKFNEFRIARPDLIPVALQISLSNLGDVQADSLRITLSRLDGNSVTPLEFFLNGDVKSSSTVINQVLPAGGTITLSGVISLPASLLKSRISLAATIDSCSGTKNTPDSCKPSQINFATNRSNTVVFTLVDPPR